MAASKPDVTEMFEKMGQRLGWFKQNDLNDTLKVLSASKKKKPSKLRLQKQSTNTKPIIDNPDVNANMKTEPKNPVKDVKGASLPKSKPTNSISKVSSFKGILSSDSDSGDECVIKGKQKSIPKGVLVVASDSEEEVPVVREDTYIECIGESPVNNARPSIASSYDISTYRKSGDKELYEETILKSRVSMATFSFDVDSIGDPLVESTRIHRRSSVSYNQFISPDTSEGKIEGTGSSDTSPCIQKPNEIKQKCAVDKNDICDQLDNLTIQIEKSENSKAGEVVDETECLESPFASPLNNSKYVTAIDNLKDFEDVNDADAQTRKGSEGEASKETVNYNTKSRQGSENDSECEVEVVDMATQTSDIEEDHATNKANIVVDTFDNHMLLQAPDIEPEYTDVVADVNDEASAQSNKILNAYGNHRHLKSDCTETKTSGVEMDSIYRNVTVTDAAVYENDTVFRNTSAEHTESMEINSKLSDYEHPTVSDTKVCNEHMGYEDLTEVETDNVYNDTTRVKSSVSVNTMSTISLTSVKEMDDKNGNKSDTDVVHSSSEDSIIEVRDISTQTDPLPKLSCSVDELVNQLDNHADPDYQDTSETSIKSNFESINTSEDKKDIANDWEISEQANTEEVIETEVEDHIEGDFSNISIDKMDTSNRSNEEDVELKEDTSVLEKIDEKLFNENDLSSISINSTDKKTDKKDKRDKSSISSNNSSTTQKKSSANFSLLSSDSESDSDDDLPNIPNIRKRVESHKQSTKEKEISQGRNESQRSDNANQSWRSKKGYSSESSDDDGQLEAFLQKLRKPVKEKSETDSEQSVEEPSLDRFIVEDDDMSSESDDNAFYIRETQKMEEESLAARLKENKGLKVNKISCTASDDENDEVFSSKLYPDSVTKHKKSTINKPKGTPRSWSLSSDSDSSNDTSPQLKQGTRQPSKNNGTRQNGKPRVNVTKKMNFEDLSSSSDDENNEPLFKTPNPIRKISKTSRNDKENFPSMNPSNVKKTFGEKGKGKTPKTKEFSGYISISDDDGDSEDDSYQSLGSISSSTDNTSSNNTSGQDDYLFSKMPTPLSKGRQSKAMTPLATRGSCTYSFLKSLSNCVEDEGRRHPEAVRYVKNFKKTREELMPNLFSLYNRTIFEGKLPSDLPLVWNKRLLRTAGYCAYKRHRGNQEDRTARVELSTKVCDSAERVRDTLVHELCHAAVWLLNGVNGGHGPFWKYWARHANRIHPELPAIGRCHSYAINTKFTYRCTKCGYSIGRHSKSLNTEKKVCGHCRGKFQLIQNDTPMTPRSASSSSLSSVPNTPRTPNRFALFVKEHYNAVKQKDKSLKHGEVMKELSKLFAENKISN